MIITDITGFKPFSHKMITVQCESQISDKCLNTWDCKLSEIAVIRKRSKSDKDNCKYCCWIINQGGTKSHFNKYIKNDLYFSNIDSQDKAYFLGWIASDGHVRRKRFTIKISDCDSYILDVLSKKMNSNIPVLHRKYGDKMWGMLDVSSMQMTKDLTKLLNIEFGPKDFTVGFPKLTDEMTWHFIRGLIDGDGHVPKINSKGKRPRIIISSCSKNMKSGLKDFLNKFNINSCVNSRSLTLNGINAVEAIQRMYNNCDYELCLKRKAELCLFWGRFFTKIKKLNMDKAKEIRSLRLDGYTVSQLENIFNIGNTTVYSVINNEIYKE